MNENEKTALKDIEEIGCHVLHVMEEEQYPGFSYSIGIEKTTHQPEVVVVGLKRELAHWIVNEYNNRVKSGETFNPNKYYSGFLEGFEVTFREVEKKHYREYFGWGNWLYKGDSFRVVQLIYPTTSGLWPWDENASEEFTRLPKLYAD